MHTKQLLNRKILNKTGNTIFLYTISFSIVMLFIYMFITVSGSGPFVMEDDSFLAYYPTISYIGEYIREILKNLFYFHTLNIHTYDFRLCFGDDIWGLFWSGLSNPFVVIFSPFFSAKRAECVYWLICISQMYCAGLAFISYCYYKKRKGITVVCGALFYLFSGYALLFYLRHYFFILPMIFLPIMLLGLEKIFDGEKPYIFIISVSASAIINFYFTYMLTIMLSIYGIFRLYNIYLRFGLKKALSLMLFCFLCYLVAIIIAAPILIPVFYKILTASRMNTDLIPDTGLFLFKADTIFDNILSFFIYYGKRGILPMLPGTFLIIALLIRKTKIFKSLWVFLFIAFLGLFTPFVGYLFNGGSNVTTRWMFIFPFLIAFAFVVTSPYLVTISEKNTIYCLKAILFYTFIAILISIMVKNDSLKLNIHTLFSVILMLLTIFGLSWGKRRLPLLYREMFLLFVVVLSAVYNAGVTEFKVIGKSSRPYAPRGFIYERTVSSSNAAMEYIDPPTGNNFFRVDTSLDSSFINSGGLFKHYGLTGYRSLMNSVFTSSQLELENRRVFFLWRLDGLDQRASMMSLASVKYFISSKFHNATAIPFGFNKIKEISLSDRNYNIYQNEYFLPLGYTYENYLTAKKYKDLPVLNKQEAQLQSVILEERLGGRFQENHNLELISKSLPYKISGMKNLIWAGNVLNTKENRAIMTLEFDTPAHTSDIYLRLRGFKEVPPFIKAHNALTIKLDMRSNIDNKYIFLPRHKHQVYFPRENYLINLGNYKQKTNIQCKVIISRKGTFKLDDIQVYAQPMDDYPAQINKLREDVLENIYVGNDKVSGTISLKKNKILCLSIPYSKGWHAKVDGKKTELLKANSLFMALPLEAGDHKIELEYHVPGFRLGLCFFALGAVILSGMIIHDKKKKKPMKENGALPPVRE